MQHLLDPTSQLSDRGGLLPQLPLSLRCLLGQDMRVHRMLSHDFSAGTDFEALLGAFMGLLLGHFWSPGWAGRTSRFERKILAL
jgi:hypothetical protein